jgi:hypothetical protein
MFVPFFSEARSKKKLYRRKGGGGRGGGGKGGGSTGAKSPVSVGGSTKSASSYGGGGGKVTTIPAGQFFAGRNSGGGTRNQVFGNQYVGHDLEQYSSLIFVHRQYGSGYPGVAGRGVAGRGFPFVFWPLAWGGAVGLGAGAYLHSNEVINLTRPSSHSYLSRAL